MFLYLLLTCCLVVINSNYNVMNCNDVNYVRYNYEGLILAIFLKYNYDDISADLSLPYV